MPSGPQGGGGLEENGPVPFSLCESSSPLHAHAHHVALCGSSVPVQDWTRHAHGATMGDPPAHAWNPQN